MSPSRADHWRRTLRWLSAGAIFALVPKCFLCLAAYAGVGTLLGIKAAPEICGASAGFTSTLFFWLAGCSLMISTALHSRTRSLCDRV